MDKNRKTIHKNAPDNPVTGNWQIIYTGFVLILLCFFIMLSSFSTLEQAKVMRFVKAFSNAVNVFTGGLSISPGDTVLNPSPDIVPKQSKLAKLLQDITVVAANIGLNNVELAVTEKGVVMTLPDKTIFKSGDAHISAGAAKTLKKVAEVVEKAGVPIRIEGHTDNVPIKRGQFQSNWELSATRAVNVLRYLDDACQIRNDYLSAVGYGQYQPLLPNTSIENRSRNRRVEIVFIQD